MKLDKRAIWLFIRKVHLLSSLHIQAFRNIVRNKVGKEVWNSEQTNAFIETDLFFPLAYQNLLTKYSQMERPMVYVLAVSLIDAILTLVKNTLTINSSDSRLPYVREIVLD